MSVGGIKVIDLGMQLGNESIALLVGLTQEDEQKVCIRVQLHPANRDYLPPNIKLALVSRSGATLQEFKSCSQDNFIQLIALPYRVRYSRRGTALLCPYILMLRRVLHSTENRYKRFTCPIGKSFKIEVAINDFRITEDFVIESLAL